MNAGLASVLVDHPFADAEPLLHSVAGSLTAGECRAQARAIADALRADKSVKGVFLDLDSPGGSTLGALEAAEALKLLVGCGRTLAGRLLMLDARSMSWDSITLGRQADCPVCGARRASPGTPGAPRGPGQ